MITIIYIKNQMPSYSISAPFFTSNLSLWFISLKTFSSDSSLNRVKSYDNADSMKLQILKENCDKSGIYHWTNKINGKTYVGRSINLYTRFKSYFSISHLMHPSKKNIIIYNVLLKYGYSQFKLEILEYCDKDIIISRKQYYLDLLNLEYNILKDAGTLLGFKHFDLTKAFISKKNEKS